MTNTPYVVHAVLMGLGQGFDVSGGDGIKQQNLRLLAGDSQDGPEQTRKSETLIRNTV